MIGQKFHKWTVISTAPNGLKGEERVLCRCDCGKEQDQPVYALKRMALKSCVDCKHKEEIKPYIGKQYNQWTIIDYAPISNDDAKLCKCKCSCGNIETRILHFVIHGQSKRCEHCRKMLHVTDFSGQKFGKWTFISKWDSTNEFGVHYKARCECGSIQKVYYYHVVNNNSGGCRKCLSFKGKLNPCYRHGMHGTSEWSTWASMKSRCAQTKGEDYEWYGKRGIKVCERWLESFDNFYKDMGPKPSKDYSIDRINNDGNYEPGNCRWATMKQQANNKRWCHNTKSKLTDDNVREIRNLLLQGIPKSHIAKKFNVSAPVVFMISAKRTYKHVI